MYIHINLKKIVFLSFINVCVYALIYPPRWYSQKPEEGVVCPGVGVMGGCEPPNGVLGTKLRFSEKVAKHS